MSVNVKSEIGKLKRVLVHCPGAEVENIIPDSLGRLLFDDIPYLKVAIEEHNHFAQILRDNGAEVFYVTGLAKEVFADVKAKNSLVKDVIGEGLIYSHQSQEALEEHFMSLAIDELIQAVISGTRKCDIKFESDSLSDMVKDDSEFFLDPIPNLYFTRDPAAVIGDSLSLHRMKTIARQHETLFMKYFAMHHPLFKGTPILSDRTAMYHMEGGDIAVINPKTLLIGSSLRTMPQAIERLAKTLFAYTEFERIIVFEIQKKRAFMHLDTIMTMLDYDKFTVHPSINDVPLFEIYKGGNKEVKARSIEDSLERTLERVIGSPPKFIVCGGGDIIASHREQWNDGANTLAIAPGVVITYDRNYVSNELLDKAGLKVIAMQSSELSRGRGGPRCMCMPLEREEI